MLGLLGKLCGAPGGFIQAFCLPLQLAVLRLLKSKAFICLAAVHFPVSGNEVRAAGLQTQRMRGAGVQQCAVV